MFSIHWTYNSNKMITDDGKCETGIKRIIGMGEYNFNRIKKKHFLF